MNLILCIHHKIGCQVLQHVLDHEEVWDLAVFTHESWEHEGNVYDLAKAHDVWVTRDSINDGEALSRRVSRRAGIGGSGLVAGFPPRMTCPNESSVGLELRGVRRPPHLALGKRRTVCPNE